MSGTRVASLRTVTYQSVLAGLLLVGCESSGGPNPPVFSAFRSIVTVADSVIASGSSTTVTLRVRDTEGADISLRGHRVAFTFDGGPSSGVLAPVVNHGDGTYTALLRG